MHGRGGYSAHDEHDLRRLDLPELSDDGRQVLKTVGGLDGRVYGGGAALRLVKALLLSAAVGAIVLGYRFVVFVITLYTI